MGPNSRAGFVSLMGVLVFVLSAGAQSETNCPRIQVTGPPGIAQQGELLRFTAVIRGDTVSHKPTYTWTLSSGKIVSGQGTKSVVVDNEDRAITATVEIGDFPAGCPNEMSEYYGGDPGPAAEKLYEVPSHQTLSELNIGFLSDTLRQYRGDALYVIIHGTDSASNEKRQAELVRTISLMGVPADRVTITTVYRGPNVTQFWRVPPGANNPEPGQFERARRDAKACPTITVTGPAGVVLPGEPMTFAVSVEPDAQERLRFKWNVTDSVIMGGQGTRLLKARYLPHAHGANVIATVTIDGLPPTCSKTASGTHPVVIDSYPILLGAINNPSYAIGSKLVESITDEMRANPNSQLYVWIYSQNERQFEKLKTRILRQLSTTKTDPSRFTLNVSSQKLRGATFWRIPPGSDNPAP